MPAASVRAIEERPAPLPIASARPAIDAAFVALSLGCHVASLWSYEAFLVPPGAEFYALSRGPNHLLAVLSLCCPIVTRRSRVPCAGERVGGRIE